jgi:polyisoprenoid-binding protein YceI
MSFAKWIACGTLMLALPVWADGSLTGVCNADFAVKATMDSFVGHVASQPVACDPARDAALTITVSIDRMATGKDKRDQAMFRMFSVTNFPTIVGTAPTAALNALDTAAGKAELPLELTIHGVTKPVAARVTKLNKTEAGLAFDAAFTVSLRDFGLKPPSVMKLIRVDNDVHVVAHVALAK